MLLKMSLSNNCYKQVFGTDIQKVHVDLVDKNTLLQCDLTVLVGGKEFLSLAEKPEIESMLDYFKPKAPRADFCNEIEGDNKEKLNIKKN